jgi:RNA-directed DNA polymerase
MVASPPTMDRDLYVKRWLAAPLVAPDGSVQQRDRGTPQGSAVSPVLANLFMHYGRAEE